MKDWFYARNKGGQQAVYSTAKIHMVLSVNVGIRIIFTDKSFLRTDTYDLEGFVSNVLDNQGVLHDIGELDCDPVD